MYMCLVFRSIEKREDNSQKSHIQDLKNDLKSPLLMETTNINFVYQLVVVKNLKLFISVFFCNFNFYFYSQLQPLDLLPAISEL